MLLFLLVTLGLFAIPPLVLFLIGNPDGGQIASALIGLFLVAATFGAIGLAASSSTDNPLVAAILTFGVLLMLWIAAWSGDAAGGSVQQVLTWLSLIGHYENFLQGVVSSADLIYFLLCSTAGLLYARQRLIIERIAD
jgi:ABC-2 type transport system permease protein